MTFGEAIAHLQAGGKAARAGWNGKGMHIYVKTFPGPDVPGWLASQTDMLATDWVRV